MLLYVLSVAALIVRYRDGTPILRQQDKWIMWSQILVMPLQMTAPVGPVGTVLELVTVPITFGAIGIAMFRYRLFDIDRLFSRTLVYGLLSGFVVDSCALGVLVVGNTFSTGNRPDSLVVAATTLAIAGLFQPVRRRLQQAVDRRFNLRRYDPARTIDVFAMRLRNHADADALRAEILAVIDVTMQPTRSSLWLPRDDARRSPVTTADRAAPGSAMADFK